jgi:protein SCO1
VDGRSATLAPGRSGSGWDDLSTFAWYIPKFFAPSSRTDRGLNLLEDRATKDPSPLSPLSPEVSVQDAAAPPPARRDTWPRLALIAVLGLLGVRWGGSAAGAAAAPAVAPAAGPGGAEGTVVSGSLNIPDVALLDQDGRKVRFWSDVVQGKVVAVSFIFTNCTTICPPLGVNFGRLRQLLGERAGRSVELISVSVDPQTDTPERLKAWAAKFGAGTGWTLLTGPKPDVDRLLRALRAYTPSYTDHSPLLLIGNAATGRWERTSGLVAATMLAAQLERLGAPPAAPRAAIP